MAADYRSARRWASLAQATSRVLLLLRTISTTNRASPRRPPPPFPNSSEAEDRPTGIKLLGTPGVATVCVGCPSTPEAAPSPAEPSLPVMEGGSHSLLAPNPVSVVTGGLSVSLAWRLRWIADAFSPRTKTAPDGSACRRVGSSVVLPIGLDMGGTVRICGADARAIVASVRRPALGGIQTLGVGLVRRLIVVVGGARLRILPLRWRLRDADVPGSRTPSLLGRSLPLDLSLHRAPSTASIVGVWAIGFLAADPQILRWVFRIRVIYRCRAAAVFSRPQPALRPGDAVAVDRS